MLATATHGKTAITVTQNDGPWVFRHSRFARTKITQPSIARSPVITALAESVEDIHTTQFCAPRMPAPHLRNRGHRCLFAQYTPREDGL